MIFTDESKFNAQLSLPDEMLDSLVETLHGRCQGTAGRGAEPIGELGEAWAEYTRMDLAQKQADALAERGDPVTVAMGDALNHAMQAQTP